MNSDDIISSSENNAIDSLAHRMSNPKLMALRAQNPFIPIIPFPNESLAYKLSAGVAQDINFPAGTKFVMFSGNGEYYVTRKGNAQVPTAVHDVDGSGALMNPEFCFFYVEEIRQLSAIAPYDMRLSVHCFTQL